MTKEINVKDAKNWDDEEAALNDRYLRDRGRDAEADEAIKVRGKGSSSDPADNETPPEGSIEVVLDWVGGDPDRAKKALDAENASDSPRVTLVDQLEAMVG